MTSQVVEKLKSIYGDLYTNDNVLITGIHTHSGPAGYFQYVLFEVREGEANPQQNSLAATCRPVDLLHTSLSIVLHVIYYTVDLLHTSLSIVLHVIYYIRGFLNVYRDCFNGVEKVKENR